MRIEITGVLLITGMLIAPVAPAGIAGIIAELSGDRGECNPPDKNGVQFCSREENGEVYYVLDGKEYKTYPVKD